MRRLALIFALALAGYSARAGQHSSTSKSYTLQVGHVVALTWTASTTPGVTYNIYVSVLSGGPYTRINPNPVNALTYQDMKAIAGNTYYYVATAVDSSGNESVNSNEVAVTVPTP